MPRAFPKELDIYILGIKLKTDDNIPNPHTGTVSYFGKNELLGVGINATLHVKVDRGDVFVERVTLSCRGNSIDERISQRITDDDDTSKRDIEGVVDYVLKQNGWDIDFIRAMLKSEKMKKDINYVYRVYGNVRNPTTNAVERVDQIVSSDYSMPYLEAMYTALEHTYGSKAKDMEFISSSVSTIYGVS